MKSKIELTRENIIRCMELQTIIYNKFSTPPPYYQQPMETMTNPLDYLIDSTHESELKMRNIQYLVETIHELEYRIKRLKQGG